VLRSELRLKNPLFLLPLKTLSVARKPLIEAWKVLNTAQCEVGKGKARETEREKTEGEKKNV
jgi:hypothetical protein